MKRLAISCSVLALLVMTAPATLARADAYYTVVCDDGNTYESVDAHAIDQGGKDDAIVHFNSTPLGLTCSPVKAPEE
jgi:hypothetical protein